MIALRFVNSHFMQLHRTVASVKSALQAYTSTAKTVGFVPTMGALHEGHISLINKAVQECDVVVVSIFVNPTQFNNSSDLANYPRVPEKDLQLLEEARVDVAFLPTEDEVYPEGATQQEYQLHGLDTVMEGRFRPDHFKGVATVVHRLFDIVRPDRAYFGEKDFQQLAIIKHLRKQLNLPMEIVGVETQRNAKGLALSSRNERLTDAQKEEALIIYKSLVWAKANVQELGVKATVNALVKDFAQSSLKLEYLEVADAETLKPLELVDPQKDVRIFIAAYAGDVRLIDNLPLN